jgi:hypothetical protein
MQKQRLLHAREIAEIVAKEIIMFTQSRVKVLLISFIILGICGSLSNASAQILKERSRLGSVELGGNISKILNGSNSGDFPYLGGVTLGFFLTPYLELEGAFGHGSKKESKWSLYTAKAVFNHKLRVMAPYAFVGLGGIRKETTGIDDILVTRFVALGGGIKVFIIKNIAAKVEFNHTRKLSGDESERKVNNIGVLGISIFF